MTLLVQLLPAVLATMEKALGSPNDAWLITAPSDSGPKMVEGDLRSENPVKTCAWTVGTKPRIHTNVVKVQSMLDNEKERQRYCDRATKSFGAAGLECLFGSLHCGIESVVWCHWNISSIIVLLIYRAHSVPTSAGYVVGFLMGKLR
jgi:hypothetical protein